MVKNYTYLVLILTAIVPQFILSQEIKIFRTSDFDLKGKVKKCLVLTHYGKEEYEFNIDGLLTKSVTRYNDQDYDVTHYKYSGDELLEKRSEVYRDDVFDENTSIANFYTIDTTENRKVTEKIISYSKEFLGQNEYHYDAEGKLIKVFRNDNEGSDETEIVYTNVKGEFTKTIKVNGIVLRSVRTSEKKGKDQGKNSIVLTKEFIEGQPNKAVEEVKNGIGLLQDRTLYYFDTKTNQFVPEASMSYAYDENNMLIKTETKTGEVVEIKEYIYQFDGSEYANWVKQIVKPENDYKTREISYYKTEKLVVEE
ncbi:hypothetical protein ACEZ3G_11605 [Maribacter algicola]|uniref:Uncharacterized protein n=1 Tax=Meishania litoralis TaxID=3434685 RepID=A0ACC7LLN2_9FLAO